MKTDPVISYFVSRNLDQLLDELDSMGQAPPQRYNNSASEVGDVLRCDSRGWSYTVRIKERRGDVFVATVLDVHKQPLFCRLRVGVTLAVQIGESHFQPVWDKSEALNGTE